MSNNLTGKKLLLILLYAPTEAEKRNIPVAGRTRLMKMIFLFEKEIWSEFKKDKSFEELDNFDFEAWHYGPFSKKILNDLEFLINQKYIEIATSKNVPIQAELAEYEYWVENLTEFQEREYDEEAFRLTKDKGIPMAEKIWNNLSKGQKKLLVEFKKVLNRAPLDRILEYVYKKYKKEGYTDKSLIRERYLS